MSFTVSVPIHGKCQDNRDLSLARLASIARILKNDYKIDPMRIIASGHRQYDPAQGCQRKAKQPKF